MKYFMGIEVAHSKIRIFISQRKYIIDLLYETRMLGCKLTNSLVNSNVKFGKGEGGAPIDKESF